MRTGSIVLGVMLALAAGAGAQGRELTFEDRAQAQRAIERVAWSHRIWPSDNPAGKPSFEATISDDEIRARIDDYLRASSAYECWYGRAVTAEQLQAELARMSADSRDPAALREIFAALGNDPFVIAECLARPTLVDRLLRNGYAQDERFHGALRCTAEAALTAGGRVADTDRTGARYEEVTWTLTTDPTATPAGPTEGTATIGLPLDDWNQKLDGLRASIGTAPPATEGGTPELLLDTYGPLEETNDAFIATAVLESAPDRVSTATLIWPKRSFNDWWQQERASAEPTPAIPQASYTLAVPTQPGCTRDSWSPIRSGVAEARYAHTAVWTGSEMLVWGGAVSLSTGGRYNPATDTWAPMSTDLNVPSGRVAHRAVWTGTEMIVWGGTTLGAGLGTRFNTGGRYNPVTNSWRPTRADATAPSGRTDFSMVWTGTEMIVWGGDVGGPYTATGGRYDPVTDTWTPTSTATGTPSARRLHAAVWTGTEMIVWGGANSLTAFSAGGRYDPNTDTWRTTSTASGVPTPRVNHLAFWTGTVMIVWGGLDTGGTYTNTGSRYNPVTDSWAATSNGANRPVPSQDYTGVWSGSEMLVWGGPSGPGARYSPASNTWRTIPTAGAPFARHGHTTVWTGREMVVWGGRTPSLTIVTETGGRYDPATDSWAPTSTGGDVPTPRFLHSAVWTGSEMIVWGGTNGSSIWQSTGGRYRPATDDWTPTSTASGVPQARRGHVAVWTGREMIVWGGDGSPAFLQSGGRYDPVNDRWSATSLASAPIGRDQPTVVWTGKEMIVFGGYDYVHETQPTDTGGRYDPALDRWSATRAGSGGPGRRQAHSAVWTGTEMIVWGGASQGYVNSGSRYDPATDAWRPTSISAGVPSARTSHTAIWDGHSMIVFAGATPPPSNSGARYDPLTDTWTPINSGPGVPAPRWLHKAVWTGAEMIAWGGQLASEVYTRTGGRYDPAVDRWSPTSIDANTPLGHNLFSAVWTGRSMILWGGTPAASSNGSYCGCPEGRLVFRDADGDGFGNTAVSAPSCDGTAPAGYVPDATDCDDGDATVYPGAPEVCDGVDDDCNDTIDQGGAALCDDDNGCTNDDCGGTAGCLHAPNTNPCDDGNACTTSDRCGGGICLPGAPLDCDDASCCTLDACEPATGCVHAPNTTPPVFSVQPSLGTCPVLWPPDHGYADFTIAETGAFAEPAPGGCDVATVSFIACASSQPENGTGTGDGNTVRDCVYETGAVHMRAERDGACSPIGRTYTTRLAAVDICGNVATSAPLAVSVWHDRGHPPTSGIVYSAASDSGTGDTRDGTNGVYGIGCGAGSVCSSAGGRDWSDSDPEAEIAQRAAIDVSNLRVDKALGGAAALSWTIPIDPGGLPVTRFHVFRRAPGAAHWDLVAELPVNTGSYADAAPENESVWLYKVTALIK